MPSYSTWKPNTISKANIDALVRNRFKSPKELRALLDKQQQHQEALCRSTAAVTKQQHYRTRYLTGVYKGQFFRIAIPPPEKQQPILLPNIPKLPQTILGSPKPFTTPPQQHHPQQHQQQQQQQQVVAAAREPFRYYYYSKEQVREFASQLRAWWNENWAVLVLNFGSICSLVGFTRSDVLELRALSVTGSFTSLIYHLSLKPRPITPIVWSCIFASVNGFKIYEVVHEREGVVQMTQEQESAYSKFFMTHGVTPKQFEMIWNKAELQTIPKGQTFIKEGQEMTHVTLVIRGETRAQGMLGRRLTAASFKKLDNDHQEDDMDGDRMTWTSGAWIGEIALLDKLWNKQNNTTKKAAGGTFTRINTKKKAGSAATTTTTVTEKQDKKADDDTAMVGAEQQQQQPRLSNQKKKKSKQQPETSDKRVGDDEEEEMDVEHDVLPRLSRHQTLALTRSSAMSSSKAMYNIVAVKDSVIMRWKHEDMEALMGKSSDLRGALTRAMTAAIVGKVINFTVSTTHQRTTTAPSSSTSRQQQPNWTAWLGDWGTIQNNLAGGVVRVQKMHASPPQSLESVESPPGGPIKKFG